MIKSYEFDLRILFKRFYCPICGEKLNVVKTVNKLAEDQKRIYYKELYPYGIPINKDVGRVRQMFNCSNCGYSNSTDNQLVIHKKQKKLKKIILDEHD